MNARCLSYLNEHISSQEGKRFLITGSSSGIGLECAKDLLYLGAEVTFMVRNQAKTEAVIASIEKELGHPVHAKIALYDQSKPETIRSCVASLPDEGYDAIVLNAGVYFPKKGSISDDGVPMTLQVNAIGTQVCFDCFHQRYPNARYIFINSIVQNSPKKGDFAPAFKGNGMKRAYEYGLSKRICALIYLNALDLGVDAHMTHPGITRTNIINAMAPWIKRAANGIFYPFTHPAWKAALGMALLCCLDYQKGTYLVPRGPFQMSGYPKEKKNPVKRITEAKDWDTFISAYLSEKNS